MADWNQLIDDAAYLLDEVASLRPLIHVIPFEERPGNELSALEILHCVDIAQEQLINEELLTEELDFTHARSRVELLRNQDTKLDPDIVLDSLLNNRKILLKIIRDRHKSRDLLERLITYERSLFKQIAERILTINPED